MGQFLHRGEHGSEPVSVAGIESSDVHPFGLVYPGQVITCAANPNPDIFVDVTPEAEEPATEEGAHFVSHDDVEPKAADGYGA